MSVKGWVVAFSLGFLRHVLNASGIMNLFPMYTFDCFSFDCVFCFQSPGFGYGAYLRLFALFLLPCSFQVVVLVLLLYLLKKRRADY